MKRYPCTKCKGRKVRKSFGDNASRPDGRALQCRTCKADASRKARASLRRDLRAIRRFLGLKVPHGNTTPTTARGR